METKIKNFKILTISFLIFLSLINCSEKNINQDGIRNYENHINELASINNIDWVFDPKIKIHINDDRLDPDHSNSSGVDYKKDDLEQVFIVLDNETGVPYDFDKDIYGYIIEGFDVDEQENYYFLAGDNPSNLVCFSEDKEIFRRSYTQFMGNAIHQFEDQLLIFDYKYNANNLFVLDKNDGMIIKSYQRIIENRVNNYH